MESSLILTRDAVADGPAQTPAPAVSSPLEIVRTDPAPTRLYRRVYDWYDIAVGLVFLLSGGAALYSLLSLGR